MFCGECGKELKDGTKFCGYCGAAQAENNVAVSGASDSVPVVMEAAAEKTPDKYEFSQPKYFLGLLGGGYAYKTIYTNIEFEETYIHIRQWQSGLFISKNENMFTLTADDISAICVEKVWAWGWVVYVILCLLGGLAGGSWWVWLCALIGLFNLKRKEILMFYKGNKMLIPDSDEDMEKVHQIITRLQQMNPRIRIVGL